MDEKVKDAMNQINAQKRLREAAAEKAEAEKIIQVKAAVRRVLYSCVVAAAFMDPPPCRRNR